MKLSINTETLRRELAFLAIAVEKEATIPILANIFLQAVSSDRLLLSTSDFELYCSTTLPCDCSQQGKICIPFAHLQAFVEHETSETICIKVDDKQHKASIHSRQRELEVYALNTNKWPVFPVAPKKTDALLDAKGLCDVSVRVCFAISAEPSRYVLNGALFETKGRVQMVGTDGRRLAIAKGEPMNGDGITWFLPDSLLRNLDKIVNAERLAMAKDEDKHCIHLSCGNRRVAIKALTGTFPDYKPVIRNLAGSKPSATIDSAAFLAAINAAWPMLDERSLALHLDFKDGRMSIEGSPGGDMRYRNSVALSQSDGALHIGFNASYLKEFCEHVTGEIEMFFVGPNDSGILRPKGDDSFLYVVMPMRL